MKDKEKRLPLAKSRRSVLASMQDEPTPVELAREHFASRHLRQAISMFLPLERQCIIARLCRKQAWEEIATELGLERSEVVACVLRARERVMAYTNFFSSAWYWRDGQASADAT